MSNTTLSDEYHAASQHLGFSFDELTTISLNGFNSAFIPWSERQRLALAASEKISGLRSQLA
jgi:adenosine deaminase